MEYGFFIKIEISVGNMNFQRFFSGFHQKNKVPNFFSYQTVKSVAKIQKISVSSQTFWFSVVRNKKKNQSVFGFSSKFFIGIENIS